MLRLSSRPRTTDVLVVVFSVLLVPASASGLLPFSVLESLGFATGAISVWLVVRTSVWTWPVGIANSACFLILFYEARLYADMALQLVFVALSLVGWWYWLRGDRGRPRRIGRIGVQEAAVVLVLTGLSTAVLTAYLRSIGDSAPFLDALTTCLSIAATYLMARKLLENWLIWIAADLIYIPLYASKDLPLTAILYGIFLAMCVRGLFAWRRSGRLFREAVVAGKFYPFHTGHKYLIGEALRESQRVVVLVCGAHEQTIPADLRGRWIQRTFPEADVVVVDQTQLGLDDHDSEGWAAATVAALGRAPDAVFSSEDYGDAYAAHLGAVHRLVDRDRLVVPISATAIRANPLAHFDRLEPQVRAHFVKRVCVLGAESTGKTTLAEVLADKFETVWVPEYGREYCERHEKQLGDVWDTWEFRHIAQIQAEREDALAEVANGLLFCDTDQFTTARFHEAYVGEQDPELERLAATRRYDLYLLCGLDVPFIQDGWRDDGPHRAAMDSAYRRFLEETGARWLDLRGPHADRIAQATAAVDELLVETAVA